MTSKKKKMLLLAAALPMVASPAAFAATQTSAGGSAFHAAAQTAAAPVDLTFANHSGKSGPMYIYMIGKLGGNGSPEGYVDQSGTFHLWNQASSSAAIPATDASIQGPTDGGSIHLKIPVKFSGRIYYSFGSKMDFKVVKTIEGLTGTVQPVPWNTDDPSRYQDWDFSELTYTDTGDLYMNSTQVDGVSNPAVVSGSGTNSASVGGINPNGFTNLVNEMLKTKGFEKSVQYDKSGNPLRVLAPDHFVNTDNSTKTYLDPYINNVWDYYSKNTLTIQPDPTNHPEIKYTGKVVNGVFIFTKNGDTSGYTMKVAKPTTEDVWGCAGEGSLIAGDDNTAPAGRQTERGTVVRSLCADFHRGVLGTQSISPSTDSSTYYKVNSMNQGLFDWYSKYVHENMPNDRAYGFAFDDVGAHESLVHIQNTTSASIDVINRGKGITGGVTTPPTTPVTPPTTPVTPPTTPVTPPSTGSGTSSQSVTVNVPSGYPGYMNLNLGSGTEASALGIIVDGKQVSTVSVNGAGKVRADVPVSSGTHTITVKSLSGKNVGSLTIDGLQGSTTPVTNPTTPVTPPTTQDSKNKIVSAVFSSASKGYGDITFGSGTKAGLVTIKVDGGSTSTIAIDGPGTVRANLSAPAGTHNVTVSSNNTLGDVSLSLK